MDTKQLENRRLIKAYLEQHPEQSVNSFARNAGIDPSNFTKMLDGTMRITNKTLVKIATTFGIDFGDISINDRIDIKKEIAYAKRHFPEESDVKVIKYYPNVDASCGGSQFLDNPNEFYSNIIIPGYSDCDVAVNAHGDSMFPLIKSGNIVLLSEWKEKYIEWGEIYLIITESGNRSIKRLYPSDNKDMVLCKSENKDNPPFEVPKNDIIKCYRVKGWITREVV